MIELEKKWIKTKSKSVIDSNEPEKWLQDYVTLAFDKKCYNENEILKEIQKTNSFSKECSIWNGTLKEDEFVHIISKTNLSYPIKNNKSAFNDLVMDKVYDPAYAEKYAVFVNGTLEGVNTIRSKLVKEIYDKFGNVEMFIDKITLKNNIEIIDSPE